MTTYTTHLDVRFAPLELIDVQAMVDACTDDWYNQTLCGVNDAVVRLGVLQGEYHWHAHEDGDEFFLVLDGTLLIDLDDRTVELGARQAMTIPRQMRHRPRAPTRTVVVMVERLTIVPTGN